MAFREILHKFSLVAHVFRAQSWLIWESSLKLNPLRDSYEVKILFIIIVTQSYVPLYLVPLLLPKMPPLILLCPSSPLLFLRNPGGSLN